MATVIFKATEACNARCVYCDVVHKKTTAVKKMSQETLEMFFVRVNEFLLERPDDFVEVIWHGGEPLLLGPEFFARALGFQRKHCEKTSHLIHHAMQSNLTLFSKKFADILREMGIDSIGTSYDPIYHVRRLRKRLDSYDYNRRFMEGIGLLEKEGFGWGVIYVVTKLSLKNPVEILQFLSNLRPQGSIMFNPVLLYKGKPKHLKITPEEFVDFLGTIFPVWWHHRERYPRVEPFYSLTRNLIEGNRSLTCCDSGECANSHINLAPDGRYSQCGRSSDWGLLDYGSIMDKSFSQVMADPQRKLLLHRNQILSEGECKGCRFWPICHGGCPLDAWSETKSFLHKSSWCYVKKGFIEKYFEPVAFNGSTVALSSNREKDSHPSSAPSKNRYRRSKEKSLVADKPSIELPWINPIGGLGDTLMISGVLKQVVERDPSQRFNMVARTKYGPILNGHPAIAHIGHPPQGIRLIGTNYWDHKDYGLPGHRAYQILARMFGLKTPVEERLYVPWGIEDDPVLMGFIPWKQRNVLICPTSSSPRKQMKIERWESLVELMSENGVGVVQAGNQTDRYVRGAYNLLGITTPRQLVSLLRHFDVLVTVDNFLMHAAHLCAVPAVVVWGPTDHRIYGYQEQVHLQTSPTCEFSGGCIGPGRGHLYSSECPEGPAHCMNQVDVESLYQAVRKILDGEKEPAHKVSKSINKVSPIL